MGADYVGKYLLKKHMNLTYIVTSQHDTKQITYYHHEKA